MSVQVQATRSGLAGGSNEPAVNINVFQILVQSGPALAYKHKRTTRARVTESGSALLIGLEVLQLGFGDHLLRENVQKPRENRRFVLPI